MWHNEECGYFYFEPLPADERGQRDSLGAAFLLRSTNVDDVVEALLANLNCKHDTRFCLDGIGVLGLKRVVRPSFGCSPGATDPRDVYPEAKAPVVTACDLQRAKVDCTFAICKDAETPPAPCSTAAVSVNKVPLTIEITNCEVEARLAARPLAEQQLQTDEYTYDDVRANEPETFRALGAQRAILHGWTSELSSVYKAKGAQSVANCAMALGMHEVHPVRTWLRTSLDDVLQLGNWLHEQLKAAKPSIKNVTAADLRDMKFEVCSLELFIWNFVRDRTHLLDVLNQIDGRKLLVKVDLMTVVGTVSSKVPTVLNLKQGLEAFFVDDTRAILEISTQAVAIWSQDGYYYMFDSKPCDMDGMHVVEDKKGAKSGE